MESLAKILAAMQHVVGAIHQLAVASPSGHPTVVALANAAQGILNDLAPKPEPEPAAEAQADEETGKADPAPVFVPPPSFVAPEPAPETPHE